MKNQKELEWDAEFGGLTKDELEQKAKERVAAKLNAHFEEKNEALKKGKSKYELPYGEYTERIKACEKRIAELPSIMDDLVQTERKRLEKEYDDAKRRDYILDSNRELWITDKMVKFMTSNEEYRAAKLELRETQNDLDKYTYKKSEWEENHRELIEQARRETEMRELLAADAATLAELGISKPVQTMPKVTDGENNISSGNNPLAMDLDALYEVAKIKRELEV